MVRARIYPMAFTKMVRGQTYPMQRSMLVSCEALAVSRRHCVQPGSLSKADKRSHGQHEAVSKLQSVCQSVSNDGMAPRTLSIPTVQEEKVRAKAYPSALTETVRIHAETKDLCCAFLQDRALRQPNSKLRHDYSVLITWRSCLDWSAIDTVYPKKTQRSSPRTARVLREQESTLRVNRYFAFCSSLRRQNGYPIRSNTTKNKFSENKNVIQGIQTSEKTLQRRHYPSALTKMGRIHAQESPAPLSWRQTTRVVPAIRCTVLVQVGSSSTPHSVKVEKLFLRLHIHEMAKRQASWKEQQR